MLSYLNTVIGFAAVFALLSLVVTTLTQLIRTFLGMKPKSLVETLLRLFGEIEGRDRFVAAILTHPTLAGQAGRKHYEILIDPAKENNDTDVVAAAKAVIGAYQHLFSRAGLGATLKTLDLDKQTIKDIGSTVYERIADKVDPETTNGLDKRLATWAAPFQRSLVDGSASTAAEPSGPVAKPHFGRLWRLATAVFPEAKGKPSALKTYVAAFYDEAAASASDSFTLKMRGVTAGVSLVIAVGFQLNAIDVWNRMSKADPKKIDAFAAAVSNLKRSVAETSAHSNTPAVPTPTDAGKSDDKDAGAKPSKAGSPEAPQPADSSKDIRGAVIELNRLVNEVEQSPVPLTPRAPAHLSDIFVLGIQPGFWLGVILLSLGAPFWFELLRSGIDMKSAFTKNDGGAK